MEGRRVRCERGKERIARRRYIMSGISRKIVSGARTAKMSVRGEGGSAGDARRWPNKYLTKSSGKLIPSLGRLLRGHTFSRSAIDERTTRPNESVPFYSAIFLVRFCDWIGAQDAGNHAPARNGERRALKILERYRNSGFSLSVIRSSRGINASRRISIDVAYVTSYLNGGTHDPETDIVKSSRIFL